MAMFMRVISWKEYVDPHFSFLIPHSSLALAIGVFDGVHLGHQALIRRICTPVPEAELFPVPTVVTFKQNPLQILKPNTFSGEIYSLEQKLCVLESLGVQMAVLIDFSWEFSKINGRAFIDLLLGCCPVKLIALGNNFRCGHRLDTGVEEIQSLAQERGTEVWIAPPVLDKGQPVSSSRIRQALTQGRIAEAERLMGRKIETIPKDFVPNRR